MTIDLVEVLRDMGDMLFLIVLFHIIMRVIHVNYPQILPKSILKEMNKFYGEERGKDEPRT
jgi:hypothetical protein